MKIVLDAGHGYQTPGKRTPDGMREYEFNRAVANYARQELLQYENVQVLFTHSDERDVPLQERTNRANSWGANVFVSIHANAFGNGGWNTAQGIETYVHNVTSARSIGVARAVHRQLIQATGRRDRGVKEANFHVLRETNMPAILCECGFMTYYPEAQLLKTESYRRTCAKAIVDGLVAYYNLRRKPVVGGVTTPPGSGLYKVQVGAFRAKENADSLERRLQSRGYNTFVFLDQGLYKVQVGAFSEKRNADSLATRLRRDGFDTFIAFERS